MYTCMFSMLRNVLHAMKNHPGGKWRRNRVNVFAKTTNKTNKQTILNNTNIYTKFLILFSFISFLIIIELLINYYFCISI